ncbi:MAG: hypothetical protein ACREIA_09600 [Opitutaceae bacterium]
MPDAPLEKQRTPFHPLCYSGTAMQPQVLLMAKLALVIIVSDGVFLNLDASFAPLADTFENTGATPELGWALKAAFIAAAAALLVNRLVRSAAMLLGILTLYTQAVSAPAYAAHLVVCGTLLILGALQPRSEQPWLVRALVSVALLVAAIAKARSMPWLLGTTIESWIATGVAHPALAWLRNEAGMAWISEAVAWIMLVCETALAICILIPNTRRGAGFGLAAYLLVAGFTLASPQMQAFSISLGLASLAFLEWPRGAIAVLWPRACGFPLWVRIGLDRYDFDGRLDWPLPPDPDAILEVDLDTRHFEDARALAAALMHFPAFLIAAFAIIWAAHLLLPPSAAAVANVVVIVPLMILFALRRLRHARHRLQTRLAASRN